MLAILYHVGTNNKKKNLFVFNTGTTIFDLTAATIQYFFLNSSDLHLVGSTYVEPVDTGKSRYLLL